MDAGLIIALAVFVVIGLVLDDNNKRRRRAKEDEEVRLQETDATDTEMEMIRLYAQQTTAAEKSAKQTGCIMWLLLGLVFGPIILIILASLLGLLPLLLALFGAS